MINRSTIAVWKSSTFDEETMSDLHHRCTGHRTDQITRKTGAARIMLEWANISFAALTSCSSYATKRRERERPGRICIERFGCDLKEMSNLLVVVLLPLSPSLFLGWHRYTNLTPRSTDNSCSSLTGAEQEENSARVALVRRRVLVETNGMNRWWQRGWIINGKKRDVKESYFECRQTRPTAIRKRCP